MSVTRMLRACVCAVALLSLLSLAAAQMGDDSFAPVMVPRQSLSDELQLSDSEPVMMRRDHTMLEAEAEMEAEVDAEKFPSKAELVNAAKKAAASVGKAAKSVAKAAAKDAKQAAIKGVKELATKAGEMLIKFGASDPQTLAAQTAAKAAADDLAKKAAAEKAAKAAKAAQKPNKAVNKSKADKKDKKSSKSAKKDKKKSPKKADKKKVDKKKADKKSSKKSDKSSKKSSKKADKKKDSKKSSKKSSSAKKGDKKDKKSSSKSSKKGDKKSKSKSSKSDKKSKSGKSSKSKSSKKDSKKSSKSGSKAASKSKKQRSSRSRDSRKPRGPRAQRGPRRAVAGWGISAQRPPRVQQRLPEARLTGAAATLTRANVRCVLCQFIVQKVKNELVAGSDDTAASASLIEAFAFANAEEQSRITSLVEVAAATDAKASALPQLFESGPDASRRFRHTDVLASRAGRARFTQVRAGTSEDAAEQRAAYLQLYSSVYASFEGLCAKRMPLAYLPYCNDMLKSYRFFAQGINYGDRAEQICMNANFCDHRSYVRTVTHNAYQREPGDA